MCLSVSMAVQFMMSQNRGLAALSNTHATEFCAVMKLQTRAKFIHSTNICLEPSTWG